MCMCVCFPFLYDVLIGKVLCLVMEDFERVSFSLKSLSRGENNTQVYQERF